MDTLNYTRERPSNSRRWVLWILLALIAVVIAGIVSAVLLPRVRSYIDESRFSRQISRCVRAVATEPADMVVFATKADVVAALSGSSSYRTVSFNGSFEGAAYVPPAWADLQSTIWAQQVALGFAPLQSSVANLYLDVWTFGDGSRALISIDLLFENQPDHVDSRLVSTVVPLNSRSAKSVKTHFIGTFTPFHPAADIVIYRGAKRSNREEIGIRWSTEDHSYLMTLKLDGFGKLDDRFQFEQWEERQKSKDD